MALYLFSLFHHAVGMLRNVCLESSTTGNFNNNFNLTVSKKDPEERIGRKKKKNRFLVPNSIKGAYN